jgi:hypothetical protein
VLILNLALRGDYGELRWGLSGLRWGGDARAEEFVLRLPSAGFSGPSIKVAPRSVSSAWMGLPAGPFMMPLGKAEGLLMKVHGSRHIGDCQHGRYGAVLFLLRGSIFFVMVLVSRVERCSRAVDADGFRH